MREFLNVCFNLFIKKTFMFTGLLRQLYKNAVQSSTNVMRQDHSDLNKLAARLIQLEQIDKDTFRLVFKH